MSRLLMPSYPLRSYDLGPSQPPQWRDLSRLNTLLVYLGIDSNVTRLKDEVLHAFTNNGPMNTWQLSAVEEAVDSATDTNLGVIDIAC